MGECDQVIDYRFEAFHFAQKTIDQMLPALKAAMGGDYQ